MKEKTAIRYKNTITLDFPYEEDLVNKVRSLPVRKWNTNTKTWTIPDNSLTLKLVSEWGFKIVSLDKPKEPDPYQEDLFLLEQRLQQILVTKLRKYQVEGVLFLNQHDGNALLADSMGLGKTVQAIAWVMLHQPLKTLVICPATLKWVWKDEFLKHARKRVIVGEGSSPNIPNIVNGQVLVANYEMLVKRQKDSKRNDFLSPWGTWALRQEFDAVIIDECTYVKQVSAKRTKAVREIARRAEHKMFLSGMPIMSRPIEIWVSANLLDPEGFPNHWHFCMRYCDGKHNGFGWDFSGASNLDELHEMLKKFMLRRLKSEVLKELPEKQYVNIPVPLENEPEYRRAQHAFLRWVLERYGTEAAQKAAANEICTRITALKHLAALGKLRASVEWIKDFVETGKKLVVYGHHHDVIYKICEELTKAKIGNVFLTGNTPVKEREWVVSQFMTNPNAKVFVGNMQAAGVGLTLTVADTCLFVEFGWTPAEMDQAADRIHRIGQESNTVTIYHMIALNSLDQDICEILDAKRQIIQQTLDGIATQTPLYQDLLNRLREKNDN